MRNHIPFGYAFARGADAPEIGCGCEVLVVANHEWLSDAQVAAIADWARKGGRLIVTGESGLWNEFGAQRFTNPLAEAVKGLANVSWRVNPDTAGGQLGWKYRVTPPKDGGKAMMKDLASIGFDPSLRFEELPEHVFVEIKETPKGFAAHLVNYDPSKTVTGAKVLVPSSAKATFEEPFGSDPSAKALGENGELPPFVQYALVEVEMVR